MSANGIQNETGENAINPADRAAGYIETYCSHGNSNSVTEDVFNFLEQAALDMEHSPRSGLLFERQKNQVVDALRKIVIRGFISSEFAIASNYLAARFEGYFRILSGLMDGDGGWKSADAKLAAEQLTGMTFDDRVDDVALAYNLVRYNQTLPVARYLTELDAKLYTTPFIAPDDNTVITNIGERIKRNRVKVQQGYWSECSFEGIFFSLLTALIFYAGAQE